MKFTKKYIVFDGEGPAHTDDVTKIQILDDVNNDKYNETAKRALEHDVERLVGVKDFDVVVDDHLITLTVNEKLDKQQKELIKKLLNDFEVVVAEGEIKSQDPNKPWDTVYQIFITTHKVNEFDNSQSTQPVKYVANDYANDYDEDQNEENAFDLIDVIIENMHIDKLQQRHIPAIIETFKNEAPRNGIRVDDKLLNTVKHELTLNAE